MQRVYTTYLVLIKILWSSSGYKNIQRSDQFLKSRLSIILTNMESKFRSPLHLEITLMFGWSYPEAQTAMWMSCDTRIQNILQKADAEQPTIQSRYQCSSSDEHIPSNESKWEDIIANEVQPQISQNLLDNWYGHENRRDREADGAIHWRLTRQKLKFAFLKQEGDTSTDRDWIISGREAARHDFSVARILVALLMDVRAIPRTHWVRFDRTRVDGSCRFSVQLETILISPRMFNQLEVYLGGGTHCKEKRKLKRTTNCASHSLGSLEKRDWRKIRGGKSQPRKVHYKTEWKRAQDAV